MDSTSLAVCLTLLAIVGIGGGGVIVKNQESGSDSMDSVWLGVTLLLLLIGSAAALFFMTK